MKKLLSVVLATLLAASCTGCSGGAASSAPADSNAAVTPESKAEESKAESPVASEGVSGPVTLKVANYAILEKGYEAFWNGIKTGFEEKNPNVTLEWVTAPYGEIKNQVINMAGGGDKVDVIFGETGWTPAFADAGLSVPVDSILSEEFMKDFDPAILDSFRMDGDVYGIPLYNSTFLLFYNKDLFTQAGLDPEKPPQSYDEMMTMAEKLSALKSADGNKVYPFGQTTASVEVSGSALTAMIYNFGGSVLDGDGKLSVDNDGFKQAFEMLQLMDSKGYNPQNAKLKDLRNLFALGQLAMYYDTSWGLNGVTSINPDAAKFTASAPSLKGGSGEGKSLLQSHCFFLVDNGGDRKIATRQFVEYVITADVLTDYLTNVTPAYPARISMKDLKVNPVLDGAKDSISNVTPITFIPQLGDLNLELCTLAQNVTVNKEDVATAIEQFKSAAAPMTE